MTRISARIGIGSYKTFSLQSSTADPSLAINSTTSASSDFTLSILNHATPYLLPRAGQLEDARSEAVG